MDATRYTTLTRQMGLFREMDVVANNIANAATTGFRQQGLVFSEHVHRSAGGASVSMAHGNVALTSFAQGSLTQTGGRFDLAIEGDGFFMVETPDGARLTRAGAFTPNNAGDLVTAQGYPVLDVGEAPIFIPPDATSLQIAEDGSISADGRLIGQVGVFQPADKSELQRQDGVLMQVPSGAELALTTKIKQGFLEGSNVDAISQIARMIEVQRAYEMGQSFLDTENERVKAALQTLIR
ncbi:flagellar hook-basal body complex protein [Cognatishimia sp. WU-CL00825]|uniref:flagellar hook-basal body complex protein n=1 Tax=Cognatishimia sp. WU-CL00825 TaxID=3127658 RepID=UPI003105BD84